MRPTYSGFVLVTFTGQNLYKIGNLEKVADRLGEISVQITEDTDGETIELQPCSPHLAEDLGRATTVFAPVDDTHAVPWSLEKRIIQHLTGHGPTTSRDLTRGLGRDWRDIFQVLTLLIGRGEVDNDGADLWFIPTNTED